MNATPNNMPKKSGRTPVPDLETLGLKMPESKVPATPKGTRPAFRRQDHLTQRPFSNNPQMQKLRGHNTRSK